MPTVSLCQYIIIKGYYNDLHPTNMVCVQTPVNTLSFMMTQSTMNEPTSFGSKIASIAVSLRIFDSSSISFKKLIVLQLKNVNCKHELVTFLS